LACPNPCGDGSTDVKGGKVKAPESPYFRVFNPL